MKTKTLALAFALSLSTIAQSNAVAGMILKGNGKEKMVLTQIDKKTFKKTLSEVVGTNTVTLTFGSISQTQTESMKNVQNKEKDLTISVIDSNSVRLVDLTSKIDETTKADVSRSLLGTVKSITIHKDDYLRLYAESTKKAFKDQLKIGSIDITKYLKKSELVMDTSDLKCLRTNETELTCEQDFSITATLE